MTLNHSLRCTLLFIFSICCFDIVNAQQAVNKPLKIFILAGQSNMLGQGKISPVTTKGTLEYIVANDPNNNYQFLVDNGGDWVVRDDVWIRDQNKKDSGLTVGYGNRASLVGPELGFGHAAGDLYENKVLIIKAAWGGRSLAEHFRPPSSGGKTGFYYEQLMRLIKEATSNLPTYVPGYDPAGGYEFAGFCWHQGYNDNLVTSWSDEYQSNLVNLISDIRSELDVPNLPFVIASSGMYSSGRNPGTYTPVENAQLAIANATLYPEFVGNVAVIDTRKNYKNLVFPFPAAESPNDEAYHWNLNSKSYVNIGLAMSDSITNLNKPRCPSRIIAVGSSSGVTLTWQNGNILPTDIRVLRNGMEISGSSPSNPASYFDVDAEPGVNNYEIQFNMPTGTCPPLAVTINTGITELRSYRSNEGINLIWKNNQSYSAIEVSRDDVILESALIGTATSFIDTNPPVTGSAVYRVRPTNGSSVVAEIRMHFGGARADLAAIYEPFDYIIGSLNNQVGSPTGLTGKWFGNEYATIGIGTQTYFNLPVSGGRLIRSSQRGTDRGDHRPISPSALADRGLLDHGATLWFSFITGYEEGANATNSSLSVALAANSFGPTSSSNRGSFITGGTGVGFHLSKKVPKAAFFPADTGNYIAASNSKPEFNTPHLGFIVGRMTWGNSMTDPDTIELFEVGSDLVLPASPISTLKVTVDQSTYDTLSIRQPRRLILDEIRFGSTYASVIGSKRSGYTDWADGFTGLNNTSKNVDFDGGGLDNVIEWALGGDPTSGADDILLTPTLVNQSDTDFIIFSYQRNDLAVDDVNTKISVEYSNNLAVWIEAVPSNDVVMSVTDGMTDGVDLVEVRLRRTLAIEGHLFVRLRATVSE